MYVCMYFAKSTKIISFTQITNAYVHSLPELKHGKENVDFRKPIRIEEDAFRRRGSWKYAKMLGNSQSPFRVMKFAKRAVL